MSSSDKKQRRSELTQRKLKKKAQKHSDKAKKATLEGELLGLRASVQKQNQILKDFIGHFQQVAVKQNEQTNILGILIAGIQILKDKGVITDDEIETEIQKMHNQSNENQKKAEGDDLRSKEGHTDEDGDRTSESGVLPDASIDPDSGNQERTEGKEIEQGSSDKSSATLDTDGSDG